MVLRGLVAVWIVSRSSGNRRPRGPTRLKSKRSSPRATSCAGAGTPGPALPYFQRAYQLARTPRTTGQLGLAELAAGYPVEAAEHLASALETPNDPSIVKFRQMLADALTMARAQIGELAIQGSPAGAEIVVNGRGAGVLPLSSTIKVPARNTEVVVRAPGHTERRELVPIAGGQRHELTVNLEKIAKLAEQPSVIAATSSPPSPTPAAAPSASAVVEHQSPDVDASGSSLRTAAWVFGGGALVAAGAGLALNLAARSNRSEFDASCTTLPTIMADPGTGGHLTTPECRDRHDAWETDRLWSIVGYATGAALAITSTVLFLSSRQKSTAAHARTQLRCGPSPNGISCHGTF